jgi:hypothetical protein
VLGRRAAVVGSAVVLAVGGGAAWAAANGSAPAKKPAPAGPAIMQQQKVQLQKLQRSKSGTGEHHCKHESQVSPADV